MYQRLGITLAENTPCIDICSNVVSQQSVCPISVGSARRAKGVRKATFTNVHPCHSELVSESATEKTLKQCKANKRGTSFVSLYASAKPLAVQGDMLFKRVAFTLAEVLITLAIVGVVAAITIPGLVTKINDKVKNTRITTIEKKLKQGTDKLMVLGHINGYETTEDFVQALSEHMKISIFCSADRIADCFPYDKINVEGTKGVIEVSGLKTPEDFGLKSSEYSNPVSFITGDGVPYIIMYKKDCSIDDGNGRANSAGCIAGIYDWNGARTPNKIVSATNKETNFFDSDIQMLGNTSYIGGYFAGQIDGSLDPVITSNGKTYKTFKVIDGRGKNYCGDDGNQNCTGSNGINTCTGSEYASYDDRGNHDYCSNNAWAAAVKKCKDLGLELPDKTALQQLYCQARGGSYNNTHTNCSGSTVNTALNEKLTAESVLNDGFWSSSPYGSVSAYAAYLSNGSPNGYTVYLNFKVVCLGE